MNATGSAAVSYTHLDVYKRQVYNTNYKCYAEHVDIKGCGACDCGETACATFKER